MTAGFVLATALALAAILAGVVHAIMARPETLLAAGILAGLCVVLALLFWDSAAFAEEAALPSPNQVGLGGAFWCLPGLVTGEVRRRRAPSPP